MSDFAPASPYFVKLDNISFEWPGVGSAIEVGSVWEPDFTSIQTDSITTESLGNFWAKDFWSASFPQPITLGPAVEAWASNQIGMTGTETRGDAAIPIDVPTSANRQRIETAPAVEVIAEWDGHVEEIYGEYFTASMQGLRGAGVAGQEEDAEIPISDVDPGDRDLLVQGGFFRLMIAYESPRVGPRRRFTTVQFRRLPAYTKRELDAAEREADELLNGFQLEESSRSAGG